MTGYAENAPGRAWSLPPSVLPCAAPSWVMPGTVAENARFLAGRVAEVGLCCFETEASAAMSEEELPAALAALPLRWHLHLPSDLPLDSGSRAAEACLRVWKRTAFLRPWAAVLHLPPDGAAGDAWLHEFLRVWTAAGLPPRLLAAENVRGASPLSRRALVAGLGLSLCLDMGHAMAYGQEDIVDEPDLAARIVLAHWSAPGEGGDGHLALTEWTPAQRGFAGRAVRRLPPQAAHLLEIFRWEGVSRSWPVLRALLESCRT